MTGRKPITNLFIAAAVGVTGLLAVTGSAFAGTADYASTATFGVPNNTGQSGIPSQVFVPPGRTAVQSLQLTKVAPSYGAGGGLDLQFRLKSPSGSEILVLANSNCTTWPNTSAFTVTDGATNEVGSPAFCSALQANPTGTSGKPNQPLSTFNGQPSAGVWTVTVVDIGLNNTFNGSWNGWNLQINHANPTLKADPAPFKIKKKFAISAVCDANCTVNTSGAAGSTTTKLAANSPTTIVAPANKKAQKKGKGVVTLTATDETGGTATTTVNAKTIKAKAKK
jgi:subtilisin-like proprotein convertase family protein